MFVINKKNSFDIYKLELLGFAPKNIFFFSIRSVFEVILIIDLFLLLFELV